MSYFGPQPPGGFGIRLAGVCAFDALYLYYEPLDVRAKRGDRRRRAPIEYGIAREVSIKIHKEYIHKKYYEICCLKLDMRDQI